MSKITLRADAKVPELPKVRFMRKNPDPSVPGPRFTDVTNLVTSLEIEALDDGSDFCALRRLDAGRNLVWRTLHPSLQETQWQAKFEYGITEPDWKSAEPIEAKETPGELVESELSK